jgi:enoyl-CoA hydratase/carnithine racemase
MRHRSGYAIVELHAAVVRIEIMPDCGSIYTLPRLVGAARAHALAMLSPIVNAEQAEQIGLICRMVEDHGQESERRNVVERLIQAAPSALTAISRIVRSSRAACDHLNYNANCRCITMDYIACWTWRRENEKDSGTVKAASVAR